MAASRTADITWVMISERKNSFELDMLSEDVLLHVIEQVFEISVSYVRAARTGHVHVHQLNLLCVFLQEGGLYRPLQLFSRHRTVAIFPTKDNDRNC